MSSVTAQSPAVGAATDVMPIAARSDGIRESTRAKAREVLALIDGQSFSVAAVSERSGLTEARIRQLLTIARSERQTERVEESVDGATAASRKKISRRTMLDRAWVTLHVDRRLWTMDRGVRSFWLDAVMTLHLLGGPDGLQLGQYGDGFENRAEFASAHGGTEADLEALFRRGLLVSLSNGGIAIPAELGLRPWGKPPLASSGVSLVAKHRPPTRPTGKGPVPGQRAFVMGMPAASSAPNGTLNTNPDAIGAAENANIFVTDDEGGANICAKGSKEAPHFSGKGDEVFLAGATTTATEESNSFGGGTGHRAMAGNLAAGENLRADENSHDGRSLPLAETPAWVTLGGELLEIIGMRRPLAISEAELVRGWLERGAFPDILRGVFHTVLGRENCPSNPALSYFDGPVLDALNVGKRIPADTPASRSAVAAAPTQKEAEAPEVPVKWETDTSEKAAVVSAWAGIRARLRDGVGDSEYRNWLRPMTLRGVDGEDVLISLPSAFVRDWVRDRHGARVTALWQVAHPSVRRVEFLVRETGGAPSNSPTNGEETGPQLESVPVIAAIDASADGATPSSLL